MSVEEIIFLHERPKLVNKERSGWDKSFAKLDAFLRQKAQSRKQWFIDEGGKGWECTLSGLC